MTITTAWDFLAVGFAFAVVGLIGLLAMSWRKAHSLPLGLVTIGALVALVGLGRFADWWG